MRGVNPLTISMIRMSTVCGDLEGIVGEESNRQSLCCTKSKLNYLYVCPQSDLGVAVARVL